jgi:hypothetical protein
MCWRNVRAVCCALKCVINNRSRIQFDTALASLPGTYWAIEGEKSFSTELVNLVQQLRGRPLQISVCAHRLANTTWGVAQGGADSHFR